MTRSQLTEKYKDKSIADAICSAKLDDPELSKSHVKDHEDVTEKTDPKVREARNNRIFEQSILKLDVNNFRVLSFH